MRKDNGEASITTIAVGVLIALFIVLAVVACRDTGGGDSYYYPRDTTHGYYDTHHHYHYYPKYNPHSKAYVKPKGGAPGVKVKPAPKSNGWSFKKSGGSGGFKSGSGSRRR